MLLVDAPDGDAQRLFGILQLDDGLLLRKIEVFHLLPEEEHVRSFFIGKGRDPDLAVGGVRAEIKARVRRVGQQLHRVADRLGNAALTQQAEAAVELLHEGVQLLKDVAEAPDRAAVQIVGHVERRLYVVGRDLAGVVGERGEARVEELKNAGYYVWMNARNDLVAGQVPGLVERHASEIYYGGGESMKAGGGDVPRGAPGGKEFYSHFGGRLGLDGNGRYYGADDEDLDAAIARIRSMPKDRPLCLFLGLINPHPPYQVEEPYYSAVDRKKLPKRIRAEETAGKADIEAAIRARQGMEQYSEADWDELRACYLGMCGKVDDMFCRLCDALKEAGEYDNSAIFFFSDHGDYTGDFGITEKAQNSFEDCLTNVPFLVKPPKGFETDAGISDSLVELVDFYATAMDFAGVILPSCLFVTVLAWLYAKYRSLSLMQGVLQSLRPAVVSMIFAAGVSILLPTLFADGTISFLAGNFQLRAGLLFAAALVCLRRFRMNPILVMTGCGAAELLLQTLGRLSGTPT